MSRADLKRRLDLVLLAAATLTFSSGLLLIFAFEMGPDAYALSAMGVQCRVWLNLHRILGAVLAAGVALHLALDGRAFLGQLRRAFRRGGAGGRLEVATYLAFSVVALTGLVAWLLVNGSAPLTGPIVLAHPPPGRDGLLEVHDTVGLVALALTANHVAHRWRFLWRAAGGVRRPPLGREA